ncbi:MAG: hypothetical protein ACI4IW_05095 [Oscillospiraceae bacterium]
MKPKTDIPLDTHAKAACNLAAAKEERRDGAEASVAPCKKRGFAVLAKLSQKITL